MTLIEQTREAIARRPERELPPEQAAQLATLIRGVQSDRARAAA